MSSVKQQQVESVLKRAVSQVLARKLSDPRIEGLVSVTRVSVSPDLAQASVFVSVLPQKYEKRTIAGLRHAGVHVQTQVKQLVDMRTVPHLEFRLDESLKKEAAVLDAIHRGLQREGIDPLDPDRDDPKPQTSQPPIGPNDPEDTPT